jgi:hypothetical protein
MIPRAEGSPVVLVQVRPGSSSQRPRLVSAFLPLWIFLVRAIIVPGANEPIFANPPAWFGVPFGFSLLAIAFAAMAIGIVLMAKTTSMRSAVLTFAFVTVPSTALVVLTPAIILLIIAVSPQTGAM